MSEWRLYAFSLAVRTEYGEVLSEIFNSAEWLDDWWFSAVWLRIRAISHARSCGHCTLSKTSRRTRESVRTVKNKIKENSKIIVRSHGQEYIKKEKIVLRFCFSTKNTPTKKESEHEVSTRMDCKFYIDLCSIIPSIHSLSYRHESLVSNIISSLVFKKWNASQDSAYRAKNVYTQALRHVYLGLL